MNIWPWSELKRLRSEKESESNRFATLQQKHFDCLLASQKELTEKSDTCTRLGTDLGAKNNEIINLRKELESCREDLRQVKRQHFDQLEDLKSVHDKEVEDHNQTKAHMRKMTTIIALREGLAGIKHLVK